MTRKPREHESELGYRQHGRAGEPPCDACREAHAQYELRRRRIREAAAQQDLGVMRIGESMGQVVDAADDTINVDAWELPPALPPPPTPDRPPATFAGWYAAENGVAYAQMQPDGTWRTLEKPVKVTTTYGFQRTGQPAPEPGDYAAEGPDTRTPADRGYGPNSPAGGWPAMIRRQLKGEITYEELGSRLDADGELHHYYRLIETSTGVPLWEGWA